MQDLLGAITRINKYCLNQWDSNEVALLVWTKLGEPVNEKSQSRHRITVEEAVFFYVETHKENVKTHLR